MSGLKSRRNSLVFVTDSGIVDLKITGVYQTQSQLTTLTLDWLQSLKQFFINVSYHILVAGSVLSQSTLTWDNLIDLIRISG